MTPEEQQATDLARWLEAGGPPPTTVDSDVLETIYALRPELAPPPSLTADDILASIGDVVFDAGDAHHREEAPASTLPPAEAPQVADVSAPANRRPAPFWLRGGVVGLLAAAAVTLVLLPTLLNSDPNQALSPAPAQREAAPAAPTGGGAVAEQAGAADRISKSEDAGSTLLAGARDKESPKPSGSREVSVGIGMPTATRATQAPPPPAVAAGAAQEEVRERLQAEDVQDDAVADLSEDEGKAPDPEMAAPSSWGGPTGQNQESNKVIQAGVADKAPRKPAADVATVGTTTNAKPASGGSYGSTSATNAAPSEEISAVARPARDAYNAGDPARARDLATSALRATGLTKQQKADLYWVLGRAEQALGRSQESAQAFEEAARLRGGR